MQALTREISNNNWTLILLILGLIILVALKKLKPSRLIGYTLAFFTKGFIAKRAEGKPIVFSTFHILLFCFCALNLSLFLYALNLHFKNDVTFIILFGLVFIYLFIRYALDYFLSKLFAVFSFTKYFIFTKFGYLYTLTILLFPILIFYFFTLKNIYFLIGSFFILFLIRFTLIIYNNKKLIISNLFYFFLYLCALEIAPLLILYKLLNK